MAESDQAGKSKTLDKYKVLSPLEHDGLRYEPGAEVELTTDQATTLGASGVIMPKKAKQ